MSIAEVWQGKAETAFRRPEPSEKHKLKSAIGRLLDIKEPSGRWFLGGLSTAVVFRNPWVKLAGLLASGVGIVKTTAKAFEPTK